MIPLRAIVVEDSEDDALLLLRVLRKGGYAVTHQQVTTAAEMKAVLTDGEWDLVLADYTLPKFSALDALALLQSMALDLPFIVVSGTIEEGQAVAAMKLGAHDYLLKGNLARLLPAIERELREAAGRHQRRQAERALRDSEARFRSLIENASDIITLVDRAGIVRYASPSVDRILGYAPEELVGQSISDWLHPEDRDLAAEVFGNVLKSPQMVLAVELRWQERKGNWRVLEVIAKQFQDGTGFTGAVLNCRDLTERLKMEEMRRDLQREKELSEMKLRFFSMASHEFRTPLSVILLSAQVLENCEPEWLDAKKLRNIHRIQDAAKSLREMLDGILTLSRIEAEQTEFDPQPIDLQQFCDRLLDEIDASLADNLPIEFTYEGASQDACLDEKLLHSILLNLLNNAIKYSPSGSKVDFQVEWQPETILFTVRDKGIGIPLSDREHLFKAFHRANNVGKIEGSGLGLAIVKKSVDLHKGKIWFESTIGEGTTFFISIPVKLRS
ncbi:MAG: PAS domain S-box protein [Cyanosarcina radialis HA8281-LM2]|jgi:PAS domain S-box-containing protein|nr:PAS domain S-box protein [Cyanosarcina radialis HA8281-LM2]